MKLIDTNIILYSLGREHPLKEPCRGLIAKIVPGEIAANIDVEVLQEVLYVYTYRNEKVKGIAACRYLLDIFPNPFPVTKNDISTAITFMDKYPSLVSRDAIHAAVVANNKLKGIISEDSDFDIIKGIKRFRCKDF
ncbi:MAG: type II toxin-antitoxin system VapC family toxin [Thermodesulfovibrionia bacterium]|nr:type II toxin-antitoxin system VapC family toxin [Thermodesulfovibrionia bacterium]